MMWSAPVRRIWPESPLRRASSSWSASAVRISPASAVVAAFTRRGFEAAMKSRRNGIRAGRSLIRSDSGPRGSNSQPGTAIRTPGRASGVMSGSAITPALPPEAWRSSGDRSNRTTACPSATSHAPTAEPTMPPPITAIFAMALANRRSVSAAVPFRPLRKHSGRRSAPPNLSPRTARPIPQATCGRPAVNRPAASESPCQSGSTSRRIGAGPHRPDGPRCGLAEFGHAEEEWGSHWNRDTFHRGKVGLARGKRDGGWLTLSRCDADHCRVSSFR